MKIRVADYIVKFLQEKNVSHIFTISGGGAMYLNDAVALNKLKYICNHHEQASVLAAESYARITGNLGVAMVTSGPGATNALTGVFEAWTDSTPIMVISGQSKRKETIYNSGIRGLRQFGIFEVNIVPIVESITKFSIMVNDPKKIKYYLEKAYHLSKTGRPGPVWIDVPLDVQGSLIDPEKLKGYKAKTENYDPSKAELAKFLNLLKNSRKPVFIVGNGIRISGATNDFLNLIKLLEIPVVTSIMGADIIEEDHPLYVGRVGLRGTRAGNFTVQNADLVIAIGTKLSTPVVGYEYKNFAPNAKKIVIDIDPSEHKKKTIKIDLLINSDAKQFIKAVVSSHEISLNFKKEWVKICKELSKKYPVCLPEYKNSKGPLNIYYFVDKISDVSKNDDVIMTDAGTAFYIVRQAIKIKKGQRLLIPGGTGAMGVNLPAGIGASLGSKRRVICITGDGSLQTNIQELQTVKFYNIPLKIFVLNNKGYLSIRNTQDNFFEKRHFGIDEKSGVSMPDFSKIAYAYGIKYFKINDIKDLDDNLQHALNYKGPVICEVLTKPIQKVIPTVSTKKLPDGTLTSTNIDDMYPFLSDKEMNDIKESLK